MWPYLTLAAHLTVKLVLSTLPVVLGVIKRHETKQLLGRYSIISEGKQFDSNRTCRDLRKWYIPTRIDQGEALLRLVNRQTFT